MLKLKASSEDVIGATLRGGGNRGQTFNRADQEVQVKPLIRPNGATLVEIDVPYDGHLVMVILYLFVCACVNLGTYPPSTRSTELILRA